MMNRHQLSARLFGISFILTFLSYGFGSAMIDTMITAENTLIYMSENSNTLIIGAILMALVHSFFNIAVPIIISPYLKVYSQRITHLYLMFAISASIVLIVGAIFLLLFLPLSDAFITSTSGSQEYFFTLALLLQKGNFFSYQLGMAIWGFGGLMLSYLLFKSKLVPRLFAIWGVVGYSIFIAGTIFELFGVAIGVEMSLVGGLFELSLSVWLIVKGFDLNSSTKTFLE